MLTELKRHENLTFNKNETAVGSFLGDVLKYFNDGCWLTRKIFAAPTPFYTKNHNHTNQQLLNLTTKPTTPLNSRHYTFLLRVEYILSVLCYLFLVPVVYVVVFSFDRVVWVFKDYV